MGTACLPNQNPGQSHRFHMWPYMFLWPSSVKTSVTLDRVTHSLTPWSLWDLMALTSEMWHRAVWYIGTIALEELVSIYQTTWRHIPEDSVLIHRIISLNDKTVMILHEIRETQCANTALQVNSNSDSRSISQKVSLFTTVIIFILFICFLYLWFI
jgi:hypothetical protein